MALAYDIAFSSESPDRVWGFEELRKEAIRQAELHDPGNADAAAAQLPRHDYGRWIEVEPIYRGLIGRHPANSTAYHRLGTLLMNVGRWSDAVDAFVAAKTRNALSPIIRYKLTVSLWSAGRISEAETEIDEALKRWPQHSAIWQTKLKLLALSGRPRMALALADDPGSRPIEEGAETFEGRRLFYTALATGIERDVERAVESMLTTARAGRNEMSAAINCAALGKSDLAIDLLEGVLLGIGNWSALRPKQFSGRFETHPLFQPHARDLWPSPKFAALVERIGLERYWAVTATAPDFRRSR